MSITAAALVQTSLVSGLSAWADDLDAVLDQFPAALVEQAAPGDARDLVARMTAAAARVSAARLAGIAVVDRQRAGRAVGALSTASWLAGQGMGAGAARREVDLATALADPDHEATRAHLAQGRLSPEHAAVVTHAKGALSDAVPQAERAQFEAELLEAAEVMDPFRLRDKAKRLAARVDPTGSGDLARTERVARAQRELVISKGRDGMYTVAGRLDPIGTATLAAALDPLAAPRPGGIDGPDPRTPARRLADALVALADRHLATSDLPDTGGVRPTVLVTMTADQLRTDLSALGVDVGCAEVVGGAVREPVSVEAARRIACDATILPAVLGGRGEILDLGSARRTASPAQRRALALRDRGCTAPGCDRPPSWCEAHHVIAWSRGGPTNLGNLLLVCDAHHDLLHADGWTIDWDGHVPVWRPPPEPPPRPPG